jgi:hypothetical protein
MSNAIDCTIMSHPACDESEAPTVPSSSARSSETTPAVQANKQPEDFFASYACINQCASSQGVAALVEGAVAGLGCLALPPACPAFLVAVPLTILEACDEGCRELESK